MNTYPMNRLAPPLLLLAWLISPCLAQHGLLRISKLVGDDGTTTIIQEDGREIRITENDDGITVEIRAEGEDPVSRTAPDLKSLEAEDAELAALYRQYCLPPEEGGMMHRLTNATGLPGSGIPQNRKVEALGIRCMEMPQPEVVAQLGRGVFVTRIAPDSRGARLGLEQYDYIVGINGVETPDLATLMGSIPAGGKLTVEVVRKGQKLPLSE
jgi:hypothetical protein